MTGNRTTELREKLDKLGIEHLDSDLPNNKQTRWNKGASGWGACYVEVIHGLILPADSIIDTRTLRIYDCTPDQAIVATLGGGALTAEQVRKAIKQHSFGIQPELGYGEGGRCFHDKSWQAIADELNATLGNGECEMEKLERFDGSDPHYRCSACGHENNEDDEPSFCPSCGRKAVK